MILINPVAERFGGILSKYMSIGMPIGLGTLAAYLKKHGHEARIVDEEIERITWNNLPHTPMVGIGVLTAQAGRAYELAKMFKLGNSDCFVVMGGVHTTSLPGEALMTGYVDAVIRGEGEEPLRQLVEARELGKDWTHIEGLSYKKDGHVVHNEKGEGIKNLDDVPPFPYELFSHPKYDKGFITTARGCPYKCSYCSQKLMTGGTYRFHSTARVIESLTTLIRKYKQKHITFLDDNFTVNKRRVKELCNTIINTGLSNECEFAIQTRADNLYDDIMPWLRDANFTTIGFGMETASDRIAASIQKGQTTELYRQKIALCKRYGIKVALFMIFGFPTETKADRDVSWEFVKKADVGFTKFNNLIPYPGTAIYDVARKEGSLTIEDDWKNFNSTLSITRSIFDKTRLPYVPEGVGEFELKCDIIRRNLQYYFSWKMVSKMLYGDRGVGWVKLPPCWYVKPGEIFQLIGIALILLTNLVVSALPLRRHNDRQV